MNYKVLYRKYRPQDFKSMVGQQHIVELLKNSIKEDKISHAYIFTGPRGTGKTSSAKIFAKAINCINSKDGEPCNECEICKGFKENPDIIEIDAASNNGVDDIRELIENSRLAPAYSAFNALLLTLEEPPKNVVFILATTDIQSVPITVLSRCQRFDFKLISINDIVDRIKYVCSEEKIDISDEAIHEIAYMSNGGLRDALSILDQVSSNNKKIELEDIIANFGSVSNKTIGELVDNIANANINLLIENLNTIKSNGVDYRLFITKLIDYLKNELINIRLNRKIHNLKFDNIYNMIFELNNTLISSRNSIDPYTFVEIILIKYVDNSVVTNTTENVQKTEKIADKEEEQTVEKEAVVNIPKEEKISEINNEINIEEAKNETSNDDVKKNNLSNKCSINIDIRINNCFAGAAKQYLTDIQTKWCDFLIYESNANKELMSYILDTQIVVASDNYAILTNTLESSVSLINEHISSLEKDFKIFFNKEYKFVCITVKKWEEEKVKYINNLKNNIKYSIIEEAEETSELPLELQDSKENDELEKLAAEIFEDNVEFR